MRRDRYRNVWIGLPIAFGLVMSLNAYCAGDKNPSQDTEKTGTLLSLFSQNGDTAADASGYGGYGSVNYDGTGETTGDDNGECNSGLLGCTDGNYNQAFKAALCNNGKTPGTNPVFYAGHYTTWDGVTWGTSGTNQDHQGVCVSVHVTYGSNSPIRLFHDGCTGYPAGDPATVSKGPKVGWNPTNWGQVFHGACVVHDLCYKAEPSFSGKTKDECDDKMEAVANAICDASYSGNDLDKCRNKAGTARTGLSLGSSAHYEAFDLNFDWRPETGGLCGSGKSYDPVTSECK